MLPAAHSTIQPSIHDHVESSKTWAGQSFDGKKHYYRLDDNYLPFIERINKFAVALFKTILTLGLALAFSSVRSQWREVLWNKREICILTDGNGNILTGGSGNLFNFLVEDLPSGLQRLVLNDTIKNLSNRQYLNLNDKQLQTIPDSIGNLSNLQTLWLGNNQLQTIPGSIGNLSKLQRLKLDGNRLHTVPDSIGDLSKLQKLQLDINQLETIPDSIGNLSNLQELRLGGNQLQTIPGSIGDLSNLQELRLNHNLLQTVPECLFRLPQTCRVNLEGNPLTQEAIQLLQTRVNTEDYDGPRITFSVHEDVVRGIPQGLSTILPNWCDDDCKAILLARLSLEQRNNLANWLARLKDTADYQVQEQAVKDRVKLLLAWLAEETGVDSLQSAHQILAEATSTCGDRVALSLNTLSLHVKLCKNGQLSLPELKDFIIGLDRYERLDKIANQKCRQLHAVDPIEVQLCYEIHLKDALGLPVEVNHMLYEQLSNVTQVDIEAARQQILAETGPDQQMTILLQHPMWKKSLESSPDFNQIKQACE